MCLQQTDLESVSHEKDEGKAFVVSLFGVKDDIKAHYSKERAKICGSTWDAFLAYSGATVEDIWGGVDEPDRKLWSVSYCKGLDMKLSRRGSAASRLDESMNRFCTENALTNSEEKSRERMRNLTEYGLSRTVARTPHHCISLLSLQARLFPVLYQQSEGGVKAVDASIVMWMQHVSEHCDSSSVQGGTSTLHAPPPGVCETTKAWLAAERLSFKEILARADPAAEFEWRRRLEKDILGGGR